MTTTTKTLPAGVAVLLTDSDVTSLTLQNVNPRAAWVLGSTDGETPPEDWGGALLVGPGEGRANVALADLFPGIAGVPRLWARADAGGAIAVGYV